MASSTPITHSALTTAAHSIAQVLPGEIIEQIHKSLCAVETDVKVKGCTRKARAFAGVCSAWRREALRRGEYSVYSMKVLKELVALFEKDGAWRGGAIGIKLDIQVTTAKGAENRSAVVKQLLQLLPNLSSIGLVLGWTTRCNIYGDDRVLLSDDVWEEMAKLTKIKEFTLEGESVFLDDLHSVLLVWTGLRSLRLEREICYEPGTKDDALAKIEQIPRLHLVTLHMVISSLIPRTLFDRLAANSPITDLSLDWRKNLNGSDITDEFISTLARLAPDVVMLNLQEFDDPSPLNVIFPLLAKCQSLHLSRFNCANVIGMQYLPELRELDLSYLPWDAEETLVPFLRARTKKLEKLRMVVEVSHEDCHSMEEAEDQYSALIDAGRKSAVNFEWDIEMG